MADDWAPGDIAICINDDYGNCRAAYKPGLPTAGSRWGVCEVDVLSEIEAAYFEVVPGTYLALNGQDHDDRFHASRFIKDRPPAVEIMRKERELVPA